MPWFMPWSDSIKKRACRYLLQRYLGQFLEEKLTLDQLSVDLYNGTGTVCNVSLDCEALNELGEAQGWPLEFVDGFVQQMDVSIPWATLLKDDSFVQVSGLSITVQPKQRTQSATSMLESMWSSMTSSMQLAAECLQQGEAEGEGPAPPQPVEGIELFAQTIDSILCRVKVRFSNTTFRMEHVPKDSHTGVALEIHVRNIDYLDEAGSDPPTNLNDAEKNKTYVISTFTTKKICFEGVTFHTDEFPSRARTFSKSVVVEPTHTQMNPHLPFAVNKESDLDTLYQSLNVESLYQSCHMASSPSTSEANERSAEPPQISNVSLEPEPILFARLAGRQEMRIRMKQSEEAVGPKVDFQLTLGSLAIFLSPRQYHILMELANGITSPHLEDSSNVPSRSHPGLESKPMRAMDFERVEAQLAGGLGGGRGIHHMSYGHGWSTANIEDSDDDEKFLPLKRREDRCQMTDSLMSSFTSSITSNASSLGSMATVGTHNNAGRRKKSSNFNEGDSAAEVSQVHIRIASLACILLHEDILTLSASMNGECLAASSVKQMKNIADEFFSKLGLFAISGYGSKDFEAASQAFDEAVSSNHLRLIAAPFVLEASERSNGSGSCLSGQLTMSRLQLHECLKTSQDHTTPAMLAVPILIFSSLDQRKSSNTGDQDTNFLNPLSKAPDVKISFKNTQRAIKVSGERKYIHPKTDVNITLEPCTVEIDISIVDRMCAMLNPQPLCRRDNISMEERNAPSNQMYLDKTTVLEQQYEVKVSCTKLCIRLRFPIADLRAPHDMSRPPWWQRSVRPDFLQARLSQASINVQPTGFSIQSREFHLYYCESEGDNEIHLGTATADEDPGQSDTTQPVTAWPTVTVTSIPPEKLNPGFLDSSSEGEMTEGVGRTGAGHSTGPSNIMGQSAAILMDRLNTRPGPFTSKKILHESDTPHCKDDEDDTEELIIPGDAAEMAEFVNYSMKNSMLQIQCNLPVVSLQLGSKHLYEVLYNRLNSDLLLWEPSAPRAPVQPSPLGLQATHGTGATFSMCKSAINYNSDSESSTSSDSNNVYYSVYDHKMRQQHRSRTVPKSMDTKERVGKINSMCFNLQIGKGLLTLYTPVRDSQNHVLPVQQGEVVLGVGRLKMCHVGGIGGNPRRALFSLQASAATLHHCGLVPFPMDRAPLRRHGCSLPAHLKKTVYPSEKGIQLKDSVQGRDLLSIAISIKPNKDYSNFKSIRVAAGISNCTLRHVMTSSQHSALSQLMDMFDVLDYPVPGYQPSTVVTELHVHLWDCAIDYRPINLPLRTVVTMGSFSVSSNVVAQSNASNLRFIAEECALFLAEGSKEGSVDLRKDYVQVMDLGLFELSLRLNDKNMTSAPRVDLRASNNVVHLRTCSDSFGALCRLINYLALDGDMLGDQGDTDTQSSITDTGTGDNLLIGVNEQPEDIRDLSKSQVQQVNELMAEAMKENVLADTTIQNENVEVDPEGVEIFFFPDESKALEREVHSLHKTSNTSSATDLTGNNFAECEPTSGEFLSDDAINNMRPEGRERVVSSSEETQPPIAVVARELGDYSVKTEEDKIFKPKLDPSKKKHNRKSSGENTDDEFCILGEDLVLGGGKTAVEPEVRWLVDEQPYIMDNHFSIPVGKGDLFKSPKNFPMAALRYTLREMTVVWHLYGGHDFEAPADKEGQAHQQSAHRSSSLGPARKHVTISHDTEIPHSPTFSHRDRDPYSVIPQSPIHSNQWGTVSFCKNSETVSHGHRETAPGGARGKAAAWTHRGGRGRRHDVLMELQLNKVRFLHETYPPNGNEASRQVLIVSSVEIRDRLASSQINKFLYQYTSEQKPKRKHANMVVVKAVHLRPEGRAASPECCLKVSLLPLRFNIDQDALLFLISFFTQLSDPELPKDSSLSSAQSGSSQSLHSIGGGSPRHQAPPPVMGVGPREPKDSDSVMMSSDCEDSVSLKDDDDSGSNPMLRSYEAERLVSENLILLEEDWKGVGRGGGSAGSSRGSHRGSLGSVTAPRSTPEPNDDAPVYFRNVVFSPEVPIRLDYTGKRVDLSHGPLAGLLMGLGQLNCSELRLKRLSYRHGLLGLEKLIRWALQEWLGDIKRHQLPGLLGGVGPMYSLLQLFQGIRDLFWLPIEQYQRDGRLVRGLQRGASSFTTSTAMAALDITARIIHLIQATAETAYDMVSPSPGLRGVRRRRKERPRQPQDIREGVTNAYHIVKEGINETAQALAEVAVSERAARGYSGAVGGVLRQLPPTALAPLLLASAAAARVLGGVRASLQPPHAEDQDDKWRHNKQ